MKRIKIAVLASERSLRSALYGMLEFFQLASELGSELDNPVAFSCDCFAADVAALPTELQGLSVTSRKTGYHAVIVPPQSREPDKEMASDAELNWLRRHHKSGAILASACVGGFVLAEAGLLEGRRATTHWMLAELFRESYPKVELIDDEMLVDEGDLVTAGGVTAWLDLVLRLAARLANPELAMRLGKYHLVDTGQREQRYYRIFQPRYNHGDELVLSLQRWIASRFSEPLGDLQLAEEASLSVRSLQRRFASATGESPARYLRKFRLSKACEFLETTRMSVDEIVWKIGYEDQSAFRKLFKEQMGLTPSEYRKRFAG